MQLLSKLLGTTLAVTLGLVAPLATASVASAQTYNYGGPGVANVSVANGSVIIIRGDSGAQMQAQINAPLVPGDYIATASGSNAEVQFDGATMLRLANNTQVRLGSLSPNSREAQLAAGTVDLAALQGGGNAQVDTPLLSVRANQSGDTRISVIGNGETLVTVRSGSATVSTANGTQTLTPGSTLVDNGGSINLQNAIGFDSFDQFNISRDQSMNTAYNANPYVSPYLAGYSNLSNYGQWQNVPGYGYAWAPNNQNGFTPYQNGQWVWEPGYGYTWVDNSPYGYATTHYGTWFNNPNYGGWNWQPPAYQYQNSSASLAEAFLPAVVSFFLSGGNGGSFDLSSLLGGLGSGLLGNNYGNANIGWIPLAPGEQYMPWYGANYTYPSSNFMTVPTVTNVYNYYSNARYGMSVIPLSSWQSGNFRRVTVVRPTQVREIVLVRGAVPVVPTTSNLRFSTRTVTRRVTLVRTFSAPRLVAKAPSVTHISFAAQRAKIQTIVRAKPKVATLPVRHVAATRPVYHPVKREPVHVTAMKPVTAHRTTTTTKKAAPAPKRESKPATMHHVTPAAKPAPKPESKPAPKPVSKPAPKPEAKPAPKPESKPAAKPVVKPESKPAPKPVAKPAVAPAAKPAVPPMAKPAEHPATKPATHANPKPHEPHAKPAPTPHSA